MLVCQFCKMHRAATAPQRSGRPGKRGTGKGVSQRMQGRKFQICSCTRNPQPLPALHALSHGSCERGFTWGAMWSRENPQRTMCLFRSRISALRSEGFDSVGSWGATTPDHSALFGLLWHMSEEHKWRAPFCHSALQRRLSAASAGKRSRSTQPRGCVDRARTQDTSGAPSRQETRPETKSGGRA